VAVATGSPLDVGEWEKEEEEERRRKGMARKTGEDVSVHFSRRAV